MRLCYSLWHIFTRFLMVVSLLCAGQVFAQSLQTEVDRETVIDGETIVLYVNGSGLTGMPDTALLLPRFRIIQSGVSSSQQIINGVSTRGFIVRLELQAKNTGATVIPAFTVDGVSSDPITIEVVPRGTPGVVPRDNVFVELAVDTESPYVQEQVVLSLKIFDDGKLLNAEPEFSGNSDYQIERLPSASEEIVERDGTEYRLNTFRYALFPQKSGELVIGPVSVPASVGDKSYGGNLIFRNTPSRRIELQSDSLTLTVKPRAAASTAAWWLPIKDLQLKSTWSDDVDKATVGEAFTLTLELLANGATATQLPEIIAPDIPGLRIYADTPKFGSQSQNDSVVSLRREKWSVIPNKSGLVAMPAIEIKWWDTVSDTEKVVTLPAREIQIQAGENDVVTASDNTLPAFDDDDSNQSQNAASDVAGGQTAADRSSDGIATEDIADDATVGRAALANEVVLPGVLNRLSGTRLVPVWWRWLALAALLLWVLTAMAWWWSGSRKNTSEINVEDDRPDEAVEWRRVKAALHQQDAKRYSEAVLQWARARWPHQSIHNLPSVGSLLGSTEVTQQMQQLDKMRYSTAHDTIALAELHQQLESAVKTNNAAGTMASPDALPQL